MIINKKKTLKVLYRMYLIMWYLNHNILLKPLGSQYSFKRYIFFYNDIIVVYTNMLYDFQFENIQLLSPSIQNMFIV